MVFVIIGYVVVGVLICASIALLFYYFRKSSKKPMNMDFYVHKVL